MAWRLRAGDERVKPKRVERLKRLMGLTPIYQRPKTSVPARQHKIWPYLLRGRTIIELKEAWRADTTDICMARGVLYLVALLDWASRKALAWCRLSTMEADFCVGAVDEAPTRYRPPEIMNTDQSSQFAARAWISCLEMAAVRGSMDGNWYLHDDILVERLWRLLEYKCVYLNAWSGDSWTRIGSGDWVRFNNRRLFGDRQVSAGWGSWGWVTVGWTLVCAGR